MIKQEIYKFWTVLSYFTRIPVPSFPYQPSYLSKGTKYFPLVGLIVGGIGGGIFYLLSLVGFSQSLSVILSMVVTIWTTGAFHEDGFADVCDGFGGGWKKEKILTIMKDSAIGAYGAIGIILLLGTKYVMLSDLKVEYVPALLMVGHAMSRFTSVCIIFFSHYVRMDESSKSKPLREKQISWKDLLVALLITVIPLIFVPWQMALMLWPIPLGIACYNRYYFTKWIGGYTGDCLGANQQLVEVGVYISALLYGIIF
ncbi:adenosylcobinamide-GDP ribazoletransferase [Halosquirtibacter xylanolyticus]|uniref:adenosylcobinamide-GDP ribazoletransferase n=1 Tax=Halosquirtibacter xylanolyticus TaxID=3374599 RepID=UPI0037481ADD|nr:adenosylcobinamide-GDP ribazoletransferase [Prolixibacteraceae bacterium]